MVKDHTHLDPAKEAARAWAKAQAEADLAERQRILRELLLAAAAEEKQRTSEREAAIAESVTKFQNYLFEEFLSPDSGTGEITSGNQAQNLADRITLGRAVVDSGALKKWAEFQRSNGDGTKVSFASPVAGKSQVTSPFGHRCAEGCKGFHAGVDLGARGGNANPDILAAADGVVLFVGAKSGYGNTVIIGHADGSQTLYAHMTGAKPPRMGDIVRQGETIGVMGSTGQSTGIHVHFEHRVGSQAIAPTINGTSALARGMVIDAPAVAVATEKPEPPKTPVAATSTPPLASTATPEPKFPVTEATGVLIAAPATLPKIASSISPAAVLA